MGLAAAFRGGAGILSIVRLRRGADDAGRRHTFPPAGVADGCSTGLGGIRQGGASFRYSPQSLLEYWRGRAAISDSGQTRPRRDRRTVAAAARSFRSQSPDLGYAAG